MATDLDALVVGNYLLLKSDQPAIARVDSKTHLGQFEVD